MLSRLLFLAWLVTKLISMKLWLADRDFPLVPVSDAFLDLPAWIHLALFASSSALMLLSLFRPFKIFIWIIIALEIISCLLDQNRWQPWEYQFLFFISAYAVFKKDQLLTNAWVGILAGTYFFGGLYKLNAAFIHDTWQYLILIKWLHFPPGNVWLLRFGYMLPLVEMLAGFSLVIPRLQKTAAVLIIFIHVFILLLLGPLGLNINAVVWPWNIFLALTLYFLFLHKRESPFRFRLSYDPFLNLILLAWWIMPWLQSIGYWDKYLSSVLYGGGVEQVFICTNNNEALTKASAYRIDNMSSIPCSPVIPVYKWGIHEMRTAPYPEPRVTRKIIDYWVKTYGDAGFYLFKPGFKSSLRTWDPLRKDWRPSE